MLAATPTPLGGAAWLVPTTIQAEDFDVGGEGVAYHDTETANLGGKYRTADGVDVETCGDTAGGYDVGWTHAGEWLNYSITNAAEGDFTLTARVASPVGGEGFHFEVDGVNVSGAMSIPKTATWQTYANVTSPTVHLTAGNHNLRLVFDTNDSAGFAGNVNWVQVASATPPVNNTIGTPYLGGPAILPGKIELENYDNGGEGVAYHDMEAANLGGGYRPTEGVDLESAKDTGGGYAIDWAKPGEWTGYSAYVGAAGKYDLAFRVANYGAGGTFHLEMDGQNVSGPIAVPDTGGFQNWATVTKAGVSLPKGPHFFKLVFDTASPYGFAGNFNWMQVTPNTPPQPTPFTGTAWTPGSGVLQAENYDNGGEGVAYHDTEAANLGGTYRPAEGVDTQTTGDTGGGYNVGWTHAGEWLDYTITIPTAGLYTLSSRVAAAGGTGGTFHVEFNGVDKTGAITIPNTGNWQTYATVDTPGIQLAAGTYVMRVAIDANGPYGFAGNLNWFNLTQTEASKNVLFFGNSFTINNNLPGLVAAVAAADGHATTTVVTQATPGWSLADHVAKLAADGAGNIIQSSLAAGQHWDAAVLEEYSTRATSVTAPPINGDSVGFRADAANIFGQVRANSANAKDVLFETWARGYANGFYSTSYANPAAMQADVRAQYDLAAADANGTLGAGAAAVSPVGEAWRGLNWAADLYDAADQYHPSGKGSLLSALVLFRTIYGEQVSQIPEAKVDATVKALGLTAADWAVVTAAADGAV